MIRLTISLVVVSKHCLQICLVHVFQMFNLNSCFNKEVEGKLVTVLGSIKLGRVENKLDDKIRSQTDK